MRALYQKRVNFLGCPATELILRDRASLKRRAIARLLSAYAVLVINLDIAYWLGLLAGTIFCASERHAMGSRRCTRVPIAANGHTEGI